MTKPTPTELGDIEAARSYAEDLIMRDLDDPLKFEIRMDAHIAGQQHGAQKEKERIWAKYKQREAQGYNAPLDLRQIIFNEGV